MTTAHSKKKPVPRKSRATKPAPAPLALAKTPRQVATRLALSVKEIEQVVAKNLTAAKAANRLARSRSEFKKVGLL